MNEAELAECHTALGVSPGVTLEELERVFMKQNFALIRGKSGAADEPNPAREAQRQALRAAYEKLSAHLQALQRQAAETAAPRKKLQLASAAVVGGTAPAVTRPPMTPLTAPPVAVPVPVAEVKPPAIKPRDPADDEFILLRFDSWKLNLLLPPLLLAVMWAVTVSPLGFFLKGFHVWMHEFGHAVPSWLAGWRATPLPFGWTPVEQTHSNFVYYGLLLMFVILGAAGVKERKVWPVIAALALAGLQFWMTWKMSERQKEFWMVFGGVGGEFVLSTLLMMAWWVQLPEKFRWGACRYVFFLLGATAFLNIWLRWREIYPGREEIPFGSMINGEEDGGGDMNRLMDDYGWKKFDIRRNYWLLGWGCWAALGATWLAFALGLNRVADWVAGKFGKAE